MRHLHSFAGGLKSITWVDNFPIANGLAECAQVVPRGEAAIGCFTGAAWTDFLHWVPLLGLCAATLRLCQLAGSMHL